MPFDTAIFPAAEMWPSECLLTVDEIEHFAPDIGIELELDEDVTLAEARGIAGGLAAFCHRERIRNEERGLTARNTRRPTE